MEAFTPHSDRARPNTRTWISVTIALVLLSAVATAAPPSSPAGFPYSTLAPFSGDTAPRYPTNCTEVRSHEQTAGVANNRETNLKCAHRPGTGVYGAFGDFKTLGSQCAWWDEATKQRRLDTEACLRLGLSVFWWFIPVLVPFVALLVLPPAFIIGRFVFNCCGGRLPSYSACCPNGDERAVFTGYSTVDVWGHKIVVLVFWVAMFAVSAVSIDLNYAVWQRKNFTYGDIDGAIVAPLYHALADNTSGMTGLVWAPEPVTLRRHEDVASAPSLPSSMALSTAAAAARREVHAADHDVDHRGRSAPVTPQTELFTTQEQWLVRNAMETTDAEYDRYNNLLARFRRSEDFRFSMVLAVQALLPLAGLVFTVVGCCNGGAALVAAVPVLSYTIAFGVVALFVSHFDMWEIKMTCILADTTVGPVIVGETKVAAACNVSAASVALKTTEPFPQPDQQEGDHAAKPIFALPPDDGFTLMYVANDVSARFVASFAAWNGPLCKPIRELCRLPPNVTTGPSLMSLTRSFTIFDNCDRNLVLACQYPTSPNATITAADVSVDALKRTLQNGVATTESGTENFTLARLGRGNVPHSVINATMPFDVSVYECEYIEAAAKTLQAYRKAFMPTITTLQQLAYQDTDCRFVHDVLSDDLMYRVCDSTLQNDFAALQGFFSMLLVVAGVFLHFVVKGIKRFRSEKCCPFPLAPSEPGYVPVHQTETLAEAQKDQSKRTTRRRIFRPLSEPSNSQSSTSSIPRPGQDESGSSLTLPAGHAAPRRAVIDGPDYDEAEEMSLMYIDSEEDLAPSHADNQDRAMQPNAAHVEHTSNHELRPTTASAFRSGNVREAQGQQQAQQGHPSRDGASIHPGLYPVAAVDAEGTVSSLGRQDPGPDGSTESQRRQQAQSGHHGSSDSAPRVERPPSPESQAYDMAEKGPAVRGNAGHHYLRGPAAEHQTMYAEFSNPSDMWRRPHAVSSPAQAPAARAVSHPIPARGPGPNPTAHAGPDAPGRYPLGAADSYLWYNGPVEGADGVVRDYAVPPRYLRLIPSHHGTASIGTFTETQDDVRHLSTHDRHYVIDMDPHGHDGQERHGRHEYHGRRHDEASRHHGVASAAAAAEDTDSTPSTELGPLRSRSCDAVVQHDTSPQKGGAYRVAPQPPSSDNNGGHAAYGSPHALPSGMAYHTARQHVDPNFYPHPQTRFAERPEAARWAHNPYSPLRQHPSRVLDSTALNSGSPHAQYRDTHAREWYPPHRSQPPHRWPTYSDELH